MSEYTVVTLEERPDLCDQVQRLGGVAWPEFIHHDPVCETYWHRLELDFPGYQFALLKLDTESVVACGHSLPLAWTGDWKDLPDEGLDWAITRGFADLEAGKQPCLQCALAVIIAHAYRGQGLSSRMVRAMGAIGKEQGFETLLVPVRPNMKKVVVRRKALM